MCVFNDKGKGAHVFRIKILVKCGLACAFY